MKSTSCDGGDIMMIIMLADCFERSKFLATAPITASSSTKAASQTDRQTNRQLFKERWSLCARVLVQCGAVGAWIAKEEQREKERETAWWNKQEQRLSSSSVLTNGATERMILLITCNHWMTIPKSWPKPIPRLFSDTKFSETETKTFFRDQIFPKPILFFPSPNWAQVLNLGSHYKRLFSLSNVGESRICFASKNLTPCGMHWNAFLIDQILAECHSFPNMYDML